MSTSIDYSRVAELEAAAVVVATDYYAQARRDKVRTVGPLVQRGATGPTFRGGNLAAQSYAGAEWLLSGPAETGKTWAGLWRLDSLLRSTPRAKATLLRKLQVSIWGTVLVTFQAIQQLREATGQAAAVPYGGEKPEWYTYPNGSKLWVGGLDNPNKILSGERDWVYANQAEELELADWEILITRTTGRGAVTETPMLFGDCNPGPEDHWITKRAELRRFETTHKDNPSLWDEERQEWTEQGKRTMARLESLTGIRRSRLLLGQWVGAEGIFFEEWDDELHTCEPFPVPGDAPIWGALDYGFAHNTAFGLYTELDGTIYKIGEHVKNGWLPPFHCKAVWALVDSLKVGRHRLREVYAGHDVFQAKGDANGKTIAEQYREAVDPEDGSQVGLNLVHANIARVPGAAELLTRLGSKELGVKPTLRIFRTCPRTVAAFKRVVHDKGNPEDVLKVNCGADGSGGDDEYDETRYGVMAKREESQEPAGSYSHSMFGGR